MSASIPSGSAGTSVRTSTFVDGFDCRREASPCSLSSPGRARSRTRTLGLRFAVTCPSARPSATSQMANVSSSLRLQRRRLSATALAMTTVAFPVPAMSHRRLLARHGPIPLQEKGELQAIRHPDIAECLRQMSLDGPLTDIEPARDLLVPRPFADQIGDHALAGGQASEAVELRSPTTLLAAAQVGLQLGDQHGEKLS